MASSPNKMPRKYVELANHKLLEHKNLHELTFNEIGFVGCSYFTHQKRQRHSIIYVILCEYTLKTQIFVKLFNGEDVDIPKGTIIHHCDKICNNCYEKFKDKGRRCKLCPNIRDMDYTLHCQPMLNL